MNNRSLGHIGIEVLCLIVIGIILDVVAGKVGIEIRDTSWFIAKVTLLLIAAFTYLPPIVDFIYEKLTGK